MGKIEFNQIGWCLEEIPKVMSKLPSKVETNEEIILANDILSKVTNLSITLEKIIMDKNFRNILNKLEHQTIFEKIKFQAEHIEKLYNDLHHMLDFMNRYILNLRRELDEKDFKNWQNSASDITEMIVKDFGNEYYELKEEFKIILHTEEELKNLLVYEEHLENVLK